jgi:DNA-binding MarR family transcriptional regulator
MPRLDAARVAAWRDLQSIVAEVTRHVDEDLRLEWAVPLGWFDVLAGLRQFGGRARPQDLAALMRIPPSSLSRRLDRLEEEGWVARHRNIDPEDHRAVEIELTPRGRTLWREMSITYRRSIQARFASLLTDEQVVAVTELNGRIDPSADGDE